MTIKSVAYKDGTDLTGVCLKCGRPQIVSIQDVSLEWAPLWATYLKATGVLAFIYKMHVQRAHLRVGYCKNHRPRTLARRLVAYTTLFVAAASLFIGSDQQHYPLLCIGIVLLFVFLGLISTSNPLKPSRIKDGWVYLPAPGLKKSARQESKESCP